MAIRRRTVAALAQQILEHQGDDGQRVRFAMERVLGQCPSDEAVQGFRAFLERYRQQALQLNLPANEATDQAWAAVARVLLTCNDFLFVD